MFEARDIDQSRCSHKVEDHELGRTQRGAYLLTCDVASRWAAVEGTVTARVAQCFVLSQEAKRAKREHKLTARRVITFEGECRHLLQGQRMFCGLQVRNRVGTHVQVEKKESSAFFGKAPVILGGKPRGVPLSKAAFALRSSRTSSMHHYRVTAPPQECCLGCETGALVGASSLVCACLIISVGCK